MRADRRRIHAPPYRFVGAPMQGGGGPMTAGGVPGPWTSFAIAGFVILAVATAITIGLTAHYLTQNVRRIDRRIERRKEEIVGLDDRIDTFNSTVIDELAELEFRIDFINDTMPEGNGTVFFDDNWWMAHGPDHSRQLTLNASMIPPGQTLDFAFPNVSGTIMLEETLPAPQTVFTDDVFEILNAGDNSKVAMFSAGAIDSGTTRTYHFPDDTGVIVTSAVYDTVGLMAAPLQNQTIPDDNWTRITFNASGASHLHDYSGSWNEDHQRFEFPREGWYSASLTVTVSDPGGIDPVSLETMIVISTGAFGHRAFPGTKVVSEPGTQTVHASVVGFEGFGGLLTAYVRHQSGGVDRQIVPYDTTGTLVDAISMHVFHTYLTVRPIFTERPSGPSFP